MSRGQLQHSLVPVMGIEVLETGTWLARGFHVPLAQTLREKKLLESRRARQSA